MNIKTMIEQQEKALSGVEDQIIAGSKYVWHTIKATTLKILKYV